MQIISDDSHQACARAVGVLRLDSMADSRTERLCELLSVSNSRHYCSYVPAPQIVPVKKNERRKQL